MDGLVQISPRVSGVWETENTPYDQAVQRRTVDLIPTADLRTALDAIGVKVLGAKEQSARITAVTDTATGLKDDTLTIGGRHHHRRRETENRRNRQRTGRLLQSGKRHRIQNDAPPLGQQPEPNHRPRTQRSPRRCSNAHRAHKVHKGRHSLKRNTRNRLRVRVYGKIIRENFPPNEGRRSPEPKRERTGRPPEQPYPRVFCKKTRSPKRYVTYLFGRGS